RVRKLMGTAERIAAGDLEARTGIHYGHEEIGNLAQALDGMAAALQKKESARSLAERELRAADQRKDEFLAMLAHELRNPLAPISTGAHLLNNAIKYTPEGGTITLRLEQDAAGDDYVLTAHDDGIGMEPALVERVFDLFTQAERTPDRSQGGLGLGLALVKSLVELHGGSVAAASPGLGQGSTFTVRLPRFTQDVAPAAQPKAAQARTHDAAPLRILLVDDNVDAVHTLQLFLRSSGHQVEVAYSATDAIELARVLVPEVCLLDIGLPDF